MHHSSYHLLVAPTSVSPWVRCCVKSYKSVHHSIISEFNLRKWERGEPWTTGSPVLRFASTYSHICKLVTTTKSFAQLLLMSNALIDDAPRPRLAMLKLVSQRPLLCACASRVPEFTVPQGEPKQTTDTAVSTMPVLLMMSSCLEQPFMSKTVPV